MNAHPGPGTLNLFAPMPAIQKPFRSFLDQHPAVSAVGFDFFDTLVYRTVAPEHTKRLASRQLAMLLGDRGDGGDIYDIRRDLEAGMCRENAQGGRDPEFSLAALAGRFRRRLRERRDGWPAGLTEAPFRELLLEIEIRVEQLVQRACPDAPALLEAVRRRGLRAFLVSDFYLPGAVFTRLLDFHGLARHFDRIFVSCDYGLTKGSGRLYARVAEHLRVPPERLAMVGDNGHADVLMAERSGLAAFHVDRRRRKARYERWSRKEAARKGDGRRLGRLFHGAVRRHGGALFPETAAALWRFTYLLFRRLVRDRVRNVFFFSREGEFLKALFEDFQRSHFGRCVIRAHYLLVSRKSTYACSLKPLEEENFFRLVDQYREMAPLDFLSSLNIPEAAAADLCRELSLDPQERLPHFGTSGAYLAILGSPRFARCCEGVRREQKNALVRYLDGFGVDYREEGLSIVDVGWRGSIQDNLFFALDEAVTLRGYYLGLLQPTNLGPANRKTGLLFEDIPLETAFCEVYNSNRSFFEMVLDASHGSADRYCPGAEEGAADGAGTPPGGIAVRTADVSEERRLFQERIQPIQARILAAFREINRLVAASGAPLPDEEWFARRHARMMCRPTRREIDFFQSLYHLENFGLFEFTGFGGGAPPSRRQRLAHLGTVLKSPERVLQTGVWPPVVLDRMGVGFLRRPFGEWYRRRMFAAGNPTRSLRRRENRLRRRQGPGRPKRIAFLLGIPEINGGTYVIFEHASRLRKRGWEVFVLTEEAVEPRRYAWHPAAGALRWATFDGVRGRRFDIAVATWWMSAYHLPRVEAVTYVYFVQSIETRFFPPEDRISYRQMVQRGLAENSYRLPLPAITEARWIRSYLRARHGSSPQLVQNGIRKDIYRESGPRHAERRAGRLRVLVEGPLGVHYKNVERTIALCRRSDADEVWLLTASAVGHVPGVDRVFSQVPILDTPEVYRSCDVLVKLSYVEGMFGPPLEMFHCGGTAVVYRITGHDEYIRDGVNSLVVTPGEEARVTACINRLKHAPETLERLKRGARETAAAWPDWDASSAAFEAALRNLETRIWPDREYLGRAADALKRHAAYEVEQLKARPRYRRQKPGSGACQFFWHDGGGFAEARSRTVRYTLGRRVVLEARFQCPRGNIRLRIDPACQAGIAAVESIVVRRGDDGPAIHRHGPESGWKGVRAGGTAALVGGQGRLLVESIGGDPQLLLPAVENSGDEAGLVAELCMRFFPFPLTAADARAVLER